MRSAPETCRICGGPVSERGRCQRCGAVYGEQYRCPHCNVVCDVEREGPRAYRCRSCGGPRVPVEEPGVERSGLDAVALKAARSARRRAVVEQIGMVIAWLVSVPIGLTALGLNALLHPGLLGIVLLVLMALIPVALAVALWRAARQSKVKGVEAEHQAWLGAARDVLQGRALEAAELARVLRTEEPEAERLLAELNASDAVSSRVTDDGRVVYAGAPRVRIQVPGEEAEFDDNAEFDAQAPAPRQRR